MSLTKKYFLVVYFILVMIFNNFLMVLHCVTKTRHKIIMTFSVTTFYIHWNVLFDFFNVLIRLSAIVHRQKVSFFFDTFRLTIHEYYYKSLTRIYLHQVCQFDIHITLWMFHIFECLWLELSFHLDAHLNFVSITACANFKCYIDVKFSS